MSNNKQTPQEKANELVNKFRDYVQFFLKWNSKQL